MLSKTDLSERISRLSPEKRALFEKRLKGEVTEKSEVKIIPPPSSEVSIPLSFSQERLWFLYKFEPDSAVYNRPLVLHFTGDLNISTLEKSLNIIIQRHEILRTIFPDHDGVPCQVVLPEEYISLPVFDVSKSKVRHIITEKSREIINLEEGPPLIPHLLRITEKEHILLLTMHHIVFDGWSEGVFLNEVTEIYRSLSAGKEPSLNPLSIQYADFAIWQREWLKGETLKKQLSYWQKKLEDIVPLELPFDHPRQPVQSSKGRRQTFMLTESLSHSLKELSSNEGVTLFITLLTSFNILLYRYTGQEDIATGTPVANRNRKEFEGLIGFFVNTLVLRSNLSKNPSFREFLGRVREVAMEAFEHQQLPFEKLVEELNPERILSRTPLFQVMFHLRNVPKKCLLLPDLKIKEFDLDTVMTKFDLTLEIEEKPEGSSCLLEYNTDLFEDRTITRMKGHFQTLLEGIVKNPDEKLSNLPILSDEEKNQLLVEWNNTLIDYPKDRCIHQLFEEQVEKTPHNIAVVFKDRKLTYRELNEKSNQMAGILRQAGVISESVLAIMVEPSIEMVIGIMAILKAGGAYVPIDPSYPVERIKYILQDTESSILLTQKHLSSKIDFKGLILFLDDENLYSGDVSNLPLINKPSHLAYIIYTSATTGKPKGVMIEHSSLSNLCFWYKYACNLNERDRSALFMSYTFDPSIKEIFSCLLAGGSLYIISKDIRLSIYRLNEYFENNNITVTNLPTQLCEEFMDIVDNKSLRLLNTGGEKLKKFKKKSYEIGNNYGPTENTVDTTRFIVDKNYDNIPIGKPIYNNRVYILDTFNNLQPVGVPGELCIGGSGLARGYLNAPDITEEKFVKNPFESGARMYKTGDLARWLPDGNIELLGRIDNQIKLRGFRIEPEEIEKVILQQDTIRAAIVVDYDDSGGQKYLCAYIISDKEINIRNLKLELSKELPDYMIPLYIIQIDKIPLTINGKVDRKALPVPDFIDRTVNYIPPETEIQKKLSDIWSEILNIHKPGIDDNFFNLGGHSLKTVIMTAKIKKIFNVEIPVKEIFRFPTIRQIARLIGRAEENIYPPFDITQKREYYPLSSQQKRLFALEQFEEMGTTYNVPISLIIEGKLDIERLYKGLEILIERHESLRTSFDIVNEEAVQKIHKNIKPEKNYIESSESNIENIIREFIKPFNFKKAPLFRYELVKLAEEKHLLLIDIHHIVIDELSINIILKELFQFYEGKELPEIRYQYKDFAVWQDKLLKSDLIKPQEEFWINKFSGEIPLLKLPIDYSRPIIQDFCGDTVLFSVESTLTEKLKSLASNTGTTLSMVLMAAFNILLSKYSSQEDIIIGTTLGGRRIEEVQYITGMFVNTLPIRNFPASHKTFMEFLNEVKENLLEVYDNEDYQLELLINKLNIKRDTGKNPLFDVL
ncbi:MAG TPA: amino acid adenylation domain-containing protein, partial [Candidatus Eremiobacteraeota bacterium]|nr:amino acid adenylation domain-containing protein [Candidatus Eremiobacteraeota bacterium]